MFFSELKSTLEPVLLTFERLGMAYHVGGSVASSAHGVARSSLDIDLVADLHARQVPPLVAALQDRYYADKPPSMGSNSFHDSLAGKSTERIQPKNQQHRVNIEH